MTLTAIIIINLVLSLLTVAAVLTLIRLAHRLPTSAPRDDAHWGRGGDPWVPSDPLPLRQLAVHEDERELERAA